MSEVISRSVLVLNRHWLAVHVCSVRRAMTLLYQQMAHVVAEDYRTYDFESWCLHSEMGGSNDGVEVIRTPGMTICVPHVIVLHRYQQCPPRVVRFNRRNIYIRDRFRCQYCGRAPGREDLTIDHVLPRSRGGASVWHNVVAACAPCNSRKGDRLPSECDMHPMRAPKRPSWLTALRVVPDKSQIAVWKRFVDSVSWELSSGQ